MMHPLGRLVRRSLRRRIFLLLASSIFTTAIVMAIGHHLLSRGGFGHPRPLIAVFILVALLWGAAGRIAWRLSAPYSELARVAKEIGAGKLSSRFNLQWSGTDESRALAQSINDMAARIEKQLADQRELLAAVSHEIRTPLARIRIIAELLRAERQAAGIAEADSKVLDELDREVVEIDALVSELLASSRLDFTALTPRTLDAVEVTARALDRAGLPATRLHVEGERTKFTGDATLVARALANLIDNAKAHGGGVDSVRVRSDNGSVVFEVEDRGPGLLAGEETRVFESFYQRPGAEAREKGALGLGLTLVQRIALAHGGRAFAMNREGGGARIGISLPLVAS